MSSLHYAIISKLSQWLLEQETPQGMNNLSFSTLLLASSIHRPMWLCHGAICIHCWVRASEQRRGESKVSQLVIPNVSSTHAQAQNHCECHHALLCLTRNPGEVYVHLRAHTVVIYGFAFCISIPVAGTLPADKKGKCKVF